VKVTYTPAGDAPQVFTFKPGLVRAGAAEMIETRSGMRYEQWVDAVLSGSVKARRVLLWHLLSLQHGHIRIEDIDFAVGELIVERDLDEALAWRITVENWKGDPALREQGLAEADDEIAKLRAEESGPKASLLSDVVDMPSTSPITST
jgi:hypothetical protein